MILDSRPLTFLEVLNWKFFLIGENVRNHSVLLDTVIRFTAEYGLIGAIALFCVVIYRAEGKRRRIEVTIALFSGLVMSQAVSYFSKSFFALPRPFEVLRDMQAPFFIPGGSAFPSGHALALFSFATTLFMFDRSLGVLGFLVAFAVSLARIVAGVHWPLDILGGALLGVLIGLVNYHFFHWLLNKKKNATVEPQNYG